MTKSILTPEQEEARQNLKRIWNLKKDELNITQERVALLCGWSSAASFGVYLHGRRPLNTDAVLKLADVLKVNPTEIMPSLRTKSRSVTWEKETDDHTKEGTDSELAAQMLDGLTPDALEFARAWQELPPAQRAAIRAATQAIVDTTQEQAKKRRAA